MSTKPLPQTYYEQRVDLWYSILEGYRAMDRDTLQIAFRFILSLAMLGLVFSGDVSGAFGVTCATITSGIDIAAFTQALKQTHTDQSRESNT